MTAGTKAIALYDNAGVDATAVYSGTEVSGFGKENAVDWQEYSLFEVEVGTNTLTWTFGSARSIDCFALWHADVPTGAACTVTLEVNTGAWVTVGSVTLDTSGNMRIERITEQTGVTAVRFVFAVSFDAVRFRQLMAGSELEMYKGQHQGVAPGTLTHGIVRTNVIATAGAILGASVRRTSKQMEISLSLLSETWVDGDWEAFAQHASTKPFAFLWDPDNRPRDAVWATANNIVAPRFADPNPSMEVSMPLTVRS